MGIEAGLVAHLSGRTRAGSRIHPLRLPQGATTPALVYQRILTGRQLHQSGASDLAEPRLQVTCWAPDYDTAIALADEVRLALGGHRGGMGGTDVRSAAVVDDVDLDDPNTGLVRRVLDIQLQHREAIRA